MSIRETDPRYRRFRGAVSELKPGSRRGIIALDGEGQPHCDFAFSDLADVLQAAGLKVGDKVTFDLVTAPAELPRAVNVRLEAQPAERQPVKAG